MIESIINGFNEVAKYIIPLLIASIPFYGLIIKKLKFMRFL